MARGIAGGGMGAQDRDADREVQLETKHLALLTLLVISLCAGSFLLGRWVERRNPSSTAAAEPTTAVDDPNVEEMGDVSRQLTFFDSLKDGRPAPLVPSSESAGRPAMATAQGGSGRGSSPAPVSQRSINEGVMIQVFASKSRSAADAVRKRLRSKGYTALLVSEGGFHKVRVGPYADRVEAERSASVLREREGLETRIP